jgi:YfiR/HmsC-like
MSTRPTLAVPVVLCFLLSLIAQQVQAQSSDAEYRVKAAFLFHFAQLVDWPAGGGINNSLSLCTLGNDPFQGALDASVAGKVIDTRILRVRHLKEPEQMHTCQILFLDSGQGKRIPGLLAALRNTPVLTVGESAGFLESGGMVRFLLQDNKVRFEINLAAAESAGLKISSRLLVLAQTVLGESRER